MTEFHWEYKRVYVDDFRRDETQDLGFWEPFFAEGLWLHLRRQVANTERINAAKTAQSKREILTP